MMKRTLCLLMLASLSMLTACVGGVDDAKQVSELTAEERETVCSNVKLEATECMVGEATTNIDAFADTSACVDSLEQIGGLANCTLTVGDFRVVRDDACSADGEAASGKLIACAFNAVSQ